MIDRYVSLLLKIRISLEGSDLRWEVHGPQLGGSPCQWNGWMMIVCPTRYHLRRHLASHISTVPIKYVVLSRLFPKLSLNESLVVLDSLLVNYCLFLLLECLRLQTLDLKVHFHLAPQPILHYFLILLSLQEHSLFLCWCFIMMWRGATAFWTSIQVSASISLSSRLLVLALDLFIEVATKCELFLAVKLSNHQILIIVS